MAWRYVLDSWGGGCTESNRRVKDGQNQDLLNFNSLLVPFTDTRRYRMLRSGDCGYVGRQRRAQALMMKAAEDLVRCTNHGE
jgi:hypothetical protein